MAKACLIGAAAAIGLWTASACAQVTSFDAASNLVTIPSVSVGAATYTNVTLQHLGNYVFTLTGATEQKPAAPGVASYDAVTRVLSLPAVRVGDTTYLDVTLQDNGSFVLTLLGASVLPPSLAAEVAAFAKASEDLFATAVPASAAARFALTDSCWANNGRTRTNAIADWETNAAAYAARDAYLVGRKIQNIQVLAVRDRLNADGSSRREVDVQWDVVHRDGSVARASKETLISGSSSGTPGCTTPQTGTALRALGNQQLVQTSVRANNLREQRYSIANGAALSPAVRFRREVQFQITDPMGNATYVIVRGPGPTNTIDGVVYPFSMKFLSPRLLRSAPELQGKAGNFLNWMDDDGFRNCRLASGAVPVVHIVDCVADGAPSNNWGWGPVATADATADQGFAAQGWVAGGVYRFDVYNDDGWKTVNGHAGKTPIATYHATLDRLPYTFVEMADRYPVIDLGGLSGAQLAANANSATPAPLSLGWTRPATPPQWPLHHLYQVWEFHQGAKIGNPGTTFNPAYRTLTRAYPGTTATSTTSFPVTPRLPDQSSKTYTEYLLYYAEPGTFNTIQSRILLQ